MNYRNKTIFDWNEYQENKISSINSLLIMNNLKKLNLSNIRNVIIRDINLQVGIIIQLNKNEYEIEDDKYFKNICDVIKLLKLDLKTFGIHYLYDSKFDKTKNLKYYLNNFIEFENQYIDKKIICLLPNSFYQANINVLHYFYEIFQKWIFQIKCDNLINIGDDGGNVCTILSSLFSNMISYFHCVDSYNCAEQMKIKNKITNLYLTFKLNDIDNFDLLNRNNLLIINPGRKGLNVNEVSVINNSKNINYIIYMACNENAFKKNINSFTKKYDIRESKKIMNMPVIEKFQFLYLIKIFN